MIKTPSTFTYEHRQPSPLVHPLSMNGIDIRFPTRGLPGTYQGRKAPSNSISRVASQGRIVVTYTAQVVSVFAGGVDVSKPLPAELCLKFAKM